MDFFNTMSKVATATTTDLQKSAELGESLNYSTAVFSNDPKKQKIANNKVICSNQFKWNITRNILNTSDDLEPPNKCGF